MPLPKQDAPVGLLRPLDTPAVRLTRYHPAADLAAFVDFYWIVRWDLDDEDRREQETLPHPCVHLVIERGASGVFGVQRGRFRRQLRGRGRAAAVRFRPGGFSAFLAQPVQSITGRVLPVDAVFGPAGAAYEHAVLAAPDDDAALVGLAEDFLRAREPREHEALALVTRAVALVEQERRIARVGDLARALGVGVRALQRLFADHVGVSPKWVICRARLQEAAARVMAGDAVDWSRLALDLGYYDQAHLISTYRAIIGVPPAEHARRTAKSR